MKNDLKQKIQNIKNDCDKVVAVVVTAVAVVVIIVIVAAAWRLKGLIQRGGRCTADQTLLLTLTSLLLLLSALLLLLLTLQQNRRGVSQQQRRWLHMMLQLVGLQRVHHATIKRITIAFRVNIVASNRNNCSGSSNSCCWQALC